MKYKEYYKYLKILLESDADPDFIPGQTNFPHGQGYPNYRPKSNDDEDFKEVAYLDHIDGVPYEHSEQDNKKRFTVLYNVIKRKYAEFYMKYQDFIDDVFAKHDELPDNNWGIYSSLYFTKENPTHSNVPDKLKGIEVNDDDIKIAKKLEDLYRNELYKLLHHRDDPHNESNYPLYVTLYDTVRAFGGHEEGGWWYDKYTIVNSIEITNPNQLLPTAEKLYSEINNFDGKPCIVVEKEKGNRIKARPSYD
jgi:hypothetical protein